MTKDIRNKLSKYEFQLKCAKYSSFIRMDMNEFNELAKIYREMYGVELTASQKSCSSCRLKAVKRMAEDYFKAPKIGRPPKIKTE